MVYFIFLASRTLKRRRMLVGEKTGRGLAGCGWGCCGARGGDHGGEGVSGKANIDGDASGGKPGDDGGGVSRRLRGR